LRPSRGEHGTLFLAGARGENPGDRLPKVMLIGEHYNLIARLVSAGTPVRLRVNVQSRFLDDRNSYNMLAELPGSDPKLRDEVVMLGAHLDSWHTATGATDNADGSAAALEAFRILEAIGAQPRRTLRLALWGGEEQGLLGARAYVNKYLAGDQNAEARKKLTVYFNIDPGKGPIYGWYMENNPAVKPIFDAWLAPFKDLDPPARRNVAGPIGSTDHVAFNGAGIPGFNPVQDFVNYDVREHHTNVDTSERVLERDLKQNAVILASFLYHAANRPEPIPSAIRR
jgi:Zn-dependent M28 family amino/carboxypeptidase